MLRSLGKLYTWWLHRSALMAAKRSRGPTAPATPPVELPPLHQAAAKGDADQVRRLLESGIAVDVQDAEGNTPLHHAIKAKAAETVRVLRTAGAKLDVRNAKGATPYSELPYLGAECKEFAKALYPAFPGLTHAGSDGVAPESVALNAGLMMALSILALEDDRGLAARVRSKVLFSRIGSSTAESNAQELAEAIREGVDPRWKDETTGQTLLHAAVHGSVPSLVSALLQAGASADAADHAGTTPLLAAMTLQEGSPQNSEKIVR